MKQEVKKLASTLASEDERSEPTSPEFVEDKEDEAADLLLSGGREPSDDEGPIDLRKKPNEKSAKTVSSLGNNNGGHRPEATTPASTEAILDIFQRTLMTAGLPPYLSPLLFLGGSATPEELAKGMAERVVPDQLPYPYRTLLPNTDSVGNQTPVVCDPYGRRHVLVQGPDGNVMTIPLTPDPSLNHHFEKNVASAGLSKGTAFKKRDYYAQKEREEEEAYAARVRYRNSLQLARERKQREEESYRRDSFSNRPKSELVSRLESAPVLSQLDYLAYAADKRGFRRSESRPVRGENNRNSARNSEPEDLSLAGSDASNEDSQHNLSRSKHAYGNGGGGGDDHEWDTYSHRGRWGPPAVEDDPDEEEEEARRFFRSRSCSDLLKFKSAEEREREKADSGLTPASLSCPSLTASSSTAASRWREVDSSDHQHRHHHHHRKRKFVTHHEGRRLDEEERMEVQSEENEDDREEEEDDGGRPAEILNAPITRLFNPKKHSPSVRPKMPRLLKVDEDEETLRREMRDTGYADSHHHPHHRHRSARYHEDEEEEVLRQSLHHRSRLASEISSEGSRMTPEQEETFLERLRHSAPVPWNVYSYYTQMMRNLTEPRHQEIYQEKRPGSNVSSPSPQRSLHQTVTSSYQPPRSPDTTNASPPNSLLVAAIASGVGNGHQNGLVPPGSPSLPDSRKTARVLTGKHVRQGTGASPATLLTLRQKIQERQRAKEMSSQTTPFGRSTSHAKVGRDLKRSKNQLPPSIPIANKSR